MPDFAATMSAWAQRTEARMTAVFRDAAQRVANETREPVGQGGNMPVVTGNLRRSLGISLNEMPELREGRYDNEPAQEITLTIASARLGDTIHLGFQANYAPYVENRYGFVRLTAQRWPQIVAESAATIEQRVENR